MNIITDKNRKTQINAVVGLLFILLLIPLFYLSNYYSEQANLYEKINEEKINELLFSEMKKFKDDLNPKVYIEKAFAEIEKRNHFPNLDSDKYKPNFSEENEPNYIKENFIEDSNAFLMEKYGIKPLLFITSNYDFQDFKCFTSKPIIPTKEAEYDVIKSVVVACILLDYKPGFHCLLHKNIESFNKAIDFIKEVNDLSRILSKYVSLFFYFGVSPKKCYEFFTNKYGIDQRSYQINNSLILREKNHGYMLGFYYCIINNSDISIDKFFESVLLSNTNSSIKRIIEEGAINKPVFEKNKENYYYKVSFPSHVVSFVNEHIFSDEKQKNTYLEFIKNRSLAIQIPTNYFENTQKKYMELINLLIFAVIILGLFIFINQYWGFISLNISLRQKINIAIIVVILIPIMLIWIILHSAIEKEQKKLISVYKDEIDFRFALFDKIKNDIPYMLCNKALEFKKKISKTYFDDRTEFYNNLHDLFFNFNMNQKGGHNVLIETFSIDYEGLMTVFCNSFNSEYKRKLNSFATVSGFYRILTDMGIIDKTSKLHQKNMRQLMLVNSFTDSFWNIYYENNILAKEGYIVPTHKMDSPERNNISLISDEKNPLKPELLLFNELDTIDISNNLITLISDKYKRILSQKSDSVMIEYGLHVRGYHDLTYENSFISKKPYPFNTLLIDAARKANFTSNSDFELLDDENGYILKKWCYFNDFPVIFTAAAIIPKFNTFDEINNILLLALLLYFLLAITLLSDTMCDSLLPPINALRIFVNIINNRIFNTEVVIDSGDELQELGYSFNKMAAGVQEREKLKRFISDKLYENLDNKDEVTNTKVTILSSDIRSFTTISEQNEPEAVVSLINEYFTLMEKSIVKYGGSIEKIIGDAISAAFYNEKSEDYAENACKAALEMRADLKKFNKIRKSKNLFTIENGIGLATGEIMIGFAGKQARRKEFLLMGNLIKKAETLEAMTKEAVSSKVYIDKETYNRVKDKIKICPERNSDVFFRELEE